MSTSVFPRRPLSPKNPYHLETYREREIIYFCLQYRYWKRRGSIVVVRKSKDEFNSATETEAIKIANCSRNAELIENACKQVNPEQWTLLLEGITNPDTNWYNFDLIKGLRCSKRAYYIQKHMVYYIVSQKDPI